MGKKGIPVLCQLCQNGSCPFITTSWYFSLCRAFTINIFATTEITRITSLSTLYGVSFRRDFAAKKARKMVNSQCFGAFTRYHCIQKIKNSHSNHKFQACLNSFDSSAEKGEFSLQVSYKISIWLKQKMSESLVPNWQVVLPWLSPETF